MFGFNPYGQQKAPRVVRKTVSGLDWNVIPEPGHEVSIRVMGLDLGQSTDHCAASVLLKRTISGEFIGPPDRRIVYERVRRYPNRLPYDVVVDNVLVYPLLDILVVEFNGVGRPVVDMLRRRAKELQQENPGYKAPRILPVLTAPSRARMHAVEEEGGVSVTVPKIDLVSSINILVQSKTLALGFSQEDQNWKHLIQELRDFQMRYTKAANLQFGNAPGVGKHDDLVISLGLASWFMNQRNAKSPGLYIP